MGSGLLLRLWLLGLKLSAMLVDPAVLQVFCGYETIQACRDWRRTDRWVNTLVWSPLLFRKCFVVRMETVSYIVVVVVYIGAVVVAVLL